jgi:hypothetical protein
MSKLPSLYILNYYEAENLFMQTEISYRFVSAQLANRFLNELKHWSVAYVKAKLYHSSDSVKITYEFDGKGFDYTCSELDDLATRYGGEEV